MGFGSQRDMCLRWRIKPLETEDSWSILIEDVEEEHAEKLPSGWIRIKQVIAGYEIKSTCDGKGCQVISVNQSVVGGCIPLRIANAYATKAPVEWRKKLDRYCKSQMTNTDPMHYVSDLFDKALDL